MAREIGSACHGDVERNGRFFNIIVTNEKLPGEAICTVSLETGSGPLKGASTIVKSERLQEPGGWRAVSGDIVESCKGDLIARLADGEFDAAINEQ